MHGPTAARGRAGARPTRVRADDARWRDRDEMIRTLAWLVALIVTERVQSTRSLQAACRAGPAQLNTGCTASKYATPASADADACCALCAADTRCVAWTFHNGSHSKTSSGGTCYLSDKADCRPVPGATGGCDQSDETCGPTDPHRCVPVTRPPAAKLAPRSCTGGHPRYRLP